MPAAKKATSTMSYQVLKPFMINGKRAEVGEVVEDIPAGSVAILMHHGKIARKGAKDLTTRDAELQARDAEMIAQAEETVKRGPGRPPKKKEGNS